MSNAIADARAALRDQLVAYLAGVLPAERIHLYTPTIIASPCVWLAQPGVEEVTAGGNGAKIRTVTFGIYMVPDGYEPVQCALLDEILARVTDALYSMPKTTHEGAVPQPIDVGGSSVRGVVAEAAVAVLAHSFCPQPIPTP